MNGLRTPRWLLDTNEPGVHSIVRICPLCLAEPNAFWRSRWLDVQRPWCDQHATWLVDRCPNCSRLLRWGHVRFLACDCGKDFREAAAVALTAEAVLAVKSVPMPVLLWLGALSRHGLAGKPLKKASRRSIAETAELLELGSGMTCEWPAAFFRTLHSCRRGAEAADGDSMELLNVAFPGLTKRIGKIRHPAWRVRIAETLGTYVASSRLSPAPLIGRNVPGVRPPSLMMIARDVGVRAERLSAVLDGLPGAEVTQRRTAGGRCRRVMTPQAIATAKEVLSRAMALKAAVRYLGMTPARVRQLVAHGRLRERCGKLDRRAVSALRESFACSAVAEHKPADPVKFEHALRYWVPVSRSAALIEAMQTGALTVYMTRPQDRPQELLLSQSQLRMWVAMPLAVDRGWLTIPEVAERLELKQEVVYHLVRVGLLPTQTMRADRRTARVVTAAGLLDFEERFEPLARAAVRAGLDYRQGLAWAKATGAHLASGPRIDGGRQYFVSRSAGFGAPASTAERVKARLLGHSHLGKDAQCRLDL